MRKGIVVLAVVAFCGLLTSTVLADVPVPQGLLFSVDIGGDLDLSDPGVNQGNEWMDCGDIYIESAPTLVKNDDGSLPAYTGYPMASAPQPLAPYCPPPPAIPPGIEAYELYFDLDASDQLSFKLVQSEGVTKVPNPQDNELVVNPSVLVMSFDDDGPPGWVVSSDVPTTVVPTHGDAVGYNEVVSDAGQFGVWSPAAVLGVRDEISLGLGSNPPTEDHDDDVDALDNHEARYHYFSVDHEANMGLDPGDIYVCDLMAGGQNLILSVDDVNDIGVSDDTDIDAWEFCAITYDTYFELFEMSSFVDESIIVGLFSVDQDDPDTLGIDESGGLLPNQIYMTDFAGNYVGLAIYDVYLYDEDIDALTVIPEPATMSLLAVGGLAMLRRRRRN